jgi:metal transporter CNNM
VIQSLWHGDQQWVPILISTVLIALFAEILPQYLIPRHALLWGYYCYPLIWGCMGLTAILSYPLSWILDIVSGRKDEYALFNNDELAAVVKYHEKSEQHGGFLSLDASRIMLGALSLDSQIIGCYISTGQESNVQDGKDLEKSGPAHINRVVVPWPSVKTISIDDPIDEAFIQKIRGWPQSRILVTGNPRYPEREVPGEPREGICIWGFLHTKVYITSVYFGVLLLPANYCCRILLDSTSSADAIQTKGLSFEICRSIQCLSFIRICLHTTSLTCFNWECHGKPKQHGRILLIAKSI